ncbi:DUF4111 domain-containing protein [Streptomyces sp. SID13726]|uniref:DUF4111 domain-containing protein n=1 Tax=Streptomyces sp. SID13726 TaxID=2706058 RepID=UPI0031B9C993
MPREDLMRGIVAGVPELLRDLDHDTRNVLLPLARVWTTPATGDIRAKDAAADWAVGRMPPEQGAVLAHARDVHLGAAEESWAGCGVRPCAEFLVAAIEGQRG